MVLNILIVHGRAYDRLLFIKQLSFKIWNILNFCYLTYFLAYFIYHYNIETNLGKKSKVLNKPCVCVIPYSGMCSMTELLGCDVPTQVSDYCSLRLRRLLLCNPTSTAPSALYVFFPTGSSWILPNSAPLYSTPGHFPIWELPGYR